MRKLLRQILPAGAAAQNPQDALQHLAVGSARATAVPMPRGLGQQGPNLFPLGVGQQPTISRHRPSPWRGSLPRSTSSCKQLPQIQPLVQGFAMASRGIGEVSNLIALSVVDKKALKEWLSSDKKTRLRKFRPSEVRKALERQEPALLLANEDWYARFCETYTHVTPQTKPNMHNAGGRGFAGGVYQPEGLKNTLGELATPPGAVSMLVC